MKLLEKIIIGLLFGLAFPLFLGLITFIFWFYLDKSENRAILFLSAGFLFGLIVDLLYLKYWIKNRYNLHSLFIAAIYFFYNVLLYGFFMGFPVFNLLMGLIAGYYFGNKIIINKIELEAKKKKIEQVSIFTSLVIALFCVSSAIMGLADKTVGKNLQGMFKLNFEITKPMIIILILTGGFTLIISQYFITKLTIIKTIKFVEKRKNLIDKPT